MIDRFDLRNVGAAGLFPLGVLFGLNAVDELYQSAFNVLLPDIRDSFGLSNTTAVLVSVLAIPAAILVSLPMGFLGDRRRRVRLAGIGAAITAVASVATALAASLWILVPGRIAGALGRSVTQPTHQGLLADWYPPEARAGVYSMWRGGAPGGGGWRSAAPGGVRGWVAVG
ncbi:MAG: MFS transporter, partial [Acidimicrobiaceae bacterium]|nr:MFS transporter [Acidimicrobiaceae bacterium]